MTAAELDSSSNGDLAERFDLTEGQVDRLRGAYALGFSFLASSRARAQVLRNAAASGIAKPLRAAKWTSRAWTPTARTSTHQAARAARPTRRYDRCDSERVHSALSTGFNSFRPHRTVSALKHVIVDVVVEKKTKEQQDNNAHSTQQESEVPGSPRKS